MSRGRVAWLLVLSLIALFHTGCANLLPAESDTPEPRRSGGACATIERFLREGLSQARRKGEAVTVSVKQGIDWCVLIDGACLRPPKTENTVLTLKSSDLDSLTIGDLPSATQSLIFSVKEKGTARDIHLTPYGSVFSIPSSS